jgi:hypothetical protein
MGTRNVSYVKANDEIKIAQSNTSMNKYIKVYCNRLKITVAVNTSAILSVERETVREWGKAKIEFWGNQGYRTRSVHTDQTVDEVLALIGAEVVDAP